VVVQVGIQGCIIAVGYLCSAGITNNQLVSSFVSITAKLVGFYNNQDIANIAWAYAVAGVDALSLLLCIYHVCLEKKDGFEVEELRQLYQSFMSTKEKSNAGLPQDHRDSSTKRSYPEFRQYQSSKTM